MFYCIIVARYNEDVPLESATACPGGKPKKLQNSSSNAFTS